MKYLDSNFLWGVILKLQEKSIPICKEYYSFIEIGFTIMLLVMIKYTYIENDSNIEVLC